MSNFNFENYMLEQIKKIGDNQELFKEDLHEVKSAMASIAMKIDEYNPKDLPLVKEKLDALDVRYIDLEKRMRDTEVQANILKGKWAILAILGGAILSLSLTALAFVLFKDDPAPAPPPQVHVVQQPALPAKNIKYETNGQNNP